MVFIKETAEMSIGASCTFTAHALIIASIHNGGTLPNMEQVMANINEFVSENLEHPAMSYVSPSDKEFQDLVSSDGIYYQCASFGQAEHAEEHPFSHMPSPPEGGTDFFILVTSSGGEMGYSHMVHMNGDIVSFIETSPQEMPWKSKHYRIPIKAFGKWFIRHFGRGVQFDAYRALFY